MKLERTFPADSLTKKEIFAISHGQSTKLSALETGDELIISKIAFYIDEKEDGDLPVVALFTNMGVFTSISVAARRTLWEFIDFMYPDWDNFTGDDEFINAKLVRGKTRIGREFINLEII